GTRDPFLPQRVEAIEIGLRPQPLEGGARRLELERGAVAISEAAAGEGQQDADARGQVRRARLLPAREGAAQGAEGLRSLALRQEQRPTGLGRDRGQGLRLETSRNRLDLFAGGARGFDVPRVQEDLD